MQGRTYKIYKIINAKGSKNFDDICNELSTEGYYPTFAPMLENDESLTQQWAKSVPIHQIGTGTTPIRQGFKY